MRIRTIRYYDSDRNLYFFRREKIQLKILKRDYISLGLSREAKKALRLKNRPRVWTEKPENELWLMVTLRYESPSKDRRAWFVDLIEMSGPYAEKSREIWLEHEKYCFEYLSRAFTYCIKNGREFKSKNWSVDLPANKYPPYKGTGEILNKMGLSLIGEWQDSGSIEENMILRRYSFEISSDKTGYRSKDRTLQ